jgi:hypothetical protein
MHRLNRRSVEKLLFLALCFGIQHSASAQNPPPLRTYRKTEITGLIGASYPMAAIGGIGVVIGKETTLGGRYGYRQLKGISASVEAGPGGLTSKLGWTSVFRYDAGAEGFSFDVVYLRTWNLKWGLERNRNWLGPGLSYRIGYAKISGAAVFKTGAGSLQLAPSLSFGLAIPLQ